MDINIEEYKILDLYREPFSNAPDPEFLYHSRQHFGTLQQLECSIKKEKGVCVVLGKSGTGKTTICRHLYRKISYEKNVDARILYAHYYESSEMLLREIANLFELSEFKTVNDIFDLLIYTYKLNGKTLALIIDNGHMIPEFCLSVLDRLAALESAGRNFFQIVIFADKEFNVNIRTNPDFESKIVNYRILGPLSFRDTKQMIAYRLKMANNDLILSKKLKHKTIFSYPAIVAIYLASGGYPRSIILLCHRCIVTMLLKKKKRADWFLVRSSAKRVLRGNNLFPESAISFAIVVIPLIILAFVMGKMSENDFTRYIKSALHLSEKITMVKPQTPQKNIANSIVEPYAIYNGESIFLPDKKPLLNERPLAAEKAVENKTLNKKENPLVIKAIVKDQINKDLAIDKRPLTMSAKEVDLMPAIPKILGTVEVKRSDTLLVMLEIVYGHSRDRYKKAVVEANTNISNIHNLDIGDMIKFPEIVALIPNNDTEKFWIKIRSAKNLNEAFGFVRKWSVLSDPVKIIPYFSSDTGLHFDIVIKKLFVNEEEASEYIKHLSDSLLVTPEIIKFSIKKNIYFADPYRV